MVAILTESGEHAVAGAEALGEALWCPARDVEAATGWEARPEGLCQGSTCVPLPAGREREFVRDGRIDLAALWRHLGQPVLHSDRGGVWILARSASERTAALASLAAPDFALPDAEGRVLQHLERRAALAIQRGRHLRQIVREQEAAGG